MHDKQSGTHFSGIEENVIIFYLNKQPDTFKYLQLFCSLVILKKKKKHTAYAFIVFIIGNVSNSRALWNIAVSPENRQDM